MTHNLSVCFLAFSTGIVLGLGPIYLMFINGLLLGVVGAACQQHGMSIDLWSFVAPHGAVELPSIILAGAAGLRLGRGVVFPGIYRWRDSVTMAGVEASRMVAGIIPLLVIAGTLEGFFLHLPHRSGSSSPSVDCSFRCCCSGSSGLFRNRAALRS
jgi:uncharacterized membrane protein SpoIIM required for sporulation